MRFVLQINSAEVKQIEKSVRHSVRETVLFDNRNCCKLTLSFKSASNYEKATSSSWRTNWVRAFPGAEPDVPIGYKAAWRSGSERRFYDDHDRKVDGSPPILVSLLRPWMRCFTMIISAWWNLASSKLKKSEENSS